MGPARLGAKCVRHLKIPNRRARTGRGAARRMRRVIRIGRQRLPPARGEFDGVGLAQDQSAGTAHDGDRRGVASHFQAVVNG